jgi:D-beta-D-heptose 7-phosphate kinase/D-beta-D-heptose 1-phosphate adenosyltransferase
VAQHSRAIVIASLKFVDAVVLFDEDTPLQLITSIVPNVLTKGADYTIENIVGSKFVADNGGEVISIPLVEGFSSSAIIKKMGDNNT